MFIYACVMIVIFIGFALLFEFIEYLENDAGRIGAYLCLAIAITVILVQNGII